jgi:dTDP-4-dehydrorhamnose 3,5-epimerase
MITITETKLERVLTVQPQAFEDHRGFYLETYNEELYSQLNVPAKFVQDDISVSYRHVMRGIHGDSETWKLISCLQGSFYLMVINNDPSHAQYRTWVGITLSEHNRLQVLIPPMFGNGHVVMSERAIFHYKQTTYYNPKGQFTLRWDDPELGLWWPISQPILSRRDQSGFFPE